MLLYSNIKKVIAYFLFIWLVVVAILSVAILSSLNLHHDSSKIKIFIKGGLIYQKGDSHPFTGRILDTLEKKIVIEYDVINGLKNGEYFVSTIDGTYTVYGFINNNKNVGMWHYYYDNGQLECIGNFNDDKPIGKWYWYYKNGTRKIEGLFINGQREGKWFNYDEDGFLHSIIHYDAGDVMSVIQVQNHKMI